MKKQSKLFLLTIIIILSTTFCLSAQNQKELSFKKTLKEVVLLCVNKDSTGLLKYIDKKTGVFFFYRPGTMDTYSNLEALSFNELVYPNFNVATDIKISVLKYSKLPEYSCDKESWSKKGCYADTTKIDHLLSNTAKNLVEYMEVEISKQTITDFQNLETKSRRVVIVAPSGNSFVLYLSYINKKWYLTMIDQVTDDCGA